MTDLTDEQLDACLDRVDEWRKTWDTFSGPEFDNLRRACNDIIELVVTCKNERAAHQATRAELERYRKRADELQRAYRNALDAARQLADAVRGHISVPDYHRSVEMVDAYKAYSAARAGQEEGE